MKNYEFLVSTCVLFGAFGAANFTLGHSYWPRGGKIVRWVFSLISSIIVLAAALYTLLVYRPDLTEHLASRLNLVIALVLLVILSAFYRRLFDIGDRATAYTPNPNQLYEAKDLTDSPETAPVAK